VKIEKASKQPKKQEPESGEFPIALVKKIIKKTFIIVEHP